MEGPAQQQCIQPFENLAEYLLNNPPTTVPQPYHDRAIFESIGGWR